MAAQSQAWNAAMAAAEAGVEEALAQINAGYGTNYVPYTKFNWGVNVDGTYGPHDATLVTGSYSVIISNDFPPTIYSSGTSVVPLLNRPVTRTVRVTTKLAPAFANAMAALQNITFNGNNIAVDSYDSSQPGVHATLGGMYDPATRMAGGNVSSTFGAIDVGNANINGKVLTGPLAPLPSVGANGFVGDLNWTGPGIEPGWYANDFNMDFPDVDMPDITGWLIPDSMGTTNAYVLGTGKYVLNGDLSLHSGDVMLVTGVAKLFVSGGVMMNGSGTSGSKIVITAGSSLEIYVAGASSSFTQVNIDPAGCNASSFQYYGLPSNTSVGWSGNASYAGTIYAPEATFTLSGSGDPKNPTDYQGSCVVNSVKMNGHFKFHYDENLQRIGPWMGYKPVTWREL
jgi:hypothetical protein